jgi:hypothetical protein
MLHGHHQHHISEHVSLPDGLSDPKGDCCMRHGMTPQATIPKVPFGIFYFQMALDLSDSYRYGYYYYYYGR